LASGGVSEPVLRCKSSSPLAPLEAPVGFQLRPGLGKEIKEKAIEVTLWEAANKLRGSVEPAEYKHVVLGLIFLKFASDKFEEHRAKLIAEGKEKYIEMPEFYNMNNVFFLEETSRWSYLIKRAKQNDIALLIDTALHTIEKTTKP
jgi:type I restriction enzyme M protein